MPDGAVRLYFRDPGGNLVEIDRSDVSQLDRSLFGERLKRLEDLHEQSAENRTATLFSERLAAPAEY